MLVIETDAVCRFMNENYTLCKIIFFSGIKKLWYNL